MDHTRHNTYDRRHNTHKVNKTAAGCGQHGCLNHRTCTRRTDVDRQVGQHLDSGLQRDVPFRGQSESASKHQMPRRSLRRAQQMGHAKRSAATRHGTDSMMLSSIFFIKNSETQGGTGQERVQGDGQRAGGRAGGAANTPQPLDLESQLTPGTRRRIDAQFLVSQRAVHLAVYQYQKTECELTRENAREAQDDFMISTKSMPPTDALATAARSSRRKL